MNIIICPGIHEIELTQSFVSSLFNPNVERGDQQLLNILVFPGEGIFTLSALHILLFLRDRLSNKLESPVIFIGFSAGVVGAIAAATTWQLQ
ncbi:MAG: hypothetical protein ACKO2Z_18435, partial [Sphaerospermopsis kisseleviana]